MGKEKEEEKKKETPEKGKKRDRKCGADWLLSGGPIGKGAEQREDKDFCPVDDKEECLVTIFVKGQTSTSYFPRKRTKRDILRKPKN